MSHNTIPLMHEVNQALKRLIQTGEGTIIDLRAIPFGPGDEARLLQLLGEGEVTASMDALGRTTVRETGFSGVWLVDHYNSEDERIAFQIEITDIPDLLRSQDDDMSESLQRLESMLSQELAGEGEGGHSVQ
ncbi:MAG: hydrogenase expression/formation protein [Sedimenticola sp.]|nr:hydrogenase expression/formation protein [Sedimenticola sp.]